MDAWLGMRRSWAKSCTYDEPAWPGVNFGQALVSCLEAMGPTTLRPVCALAVLGARATTALLAWSR
jgi:hypothetical protein